jgi:hypothetical protein
MRDGANRFLRETRQFVDETLRSLRPFPTFAVNSFFTAKLAKERKEALHPLAMPLFCRCWLSINLGHAGISPLSGGVAEDGRFSSLAEPPKTCPSSIA